MKITAGLGHTEDYPAYVQAGADEVFCGYVPDFWYQKYGMQSPLNRREVKYAHVQLGGRNELKILHSMFEDYGVPVTLTLNALFYLPEQYPLIADLMDQCVTDGFSDFIIADPALLVYLKHKGPNVRIHLSGEAFTMNPDAIHHFDDPSIQRIIFHRHLSITDIRLLISSCPHPGKEFEAFILNERCHFHGALCASVHCDELSPMCRVPYVLQSGKASVSSIDDPDDPNPALFGSTGCGLCALPELKECGVTHLKIVGRGNFSEAMIRDISLVRQAVRLMEEGISKQRYMESIQHLNPSGCSHNCYY
ncbi:MAG: U32 family peptidase [Clostridia bacterium]|nr:U32 family peptidase [Clostridia bacterium]